MTNPADFSDIIEVEESTNRKHVNVFLEAGYVLLDVQLVTFRRSGFLEHGPLYIMGRCDDVPHVSYADAMKRAEQDAQEHSQGPALSLVA